jgi:hypothetical protein
MGAVKWQANIEESVPSPGGQCCLNYVAMMEQWRESPRLRSIHAITEHVGGSTGVPMLTP